MIFQAFLDSLTPRSVKEVSSLIDDINKQVNAVKENIKVNGVILEERFGKAAKKVTH